MRTPSIVGAIALAAAGCGGGSPAGPTGAAATHTVVVTVFHDIDDNGMVDPRETARVPGVTVEVAGRTAVTQPLTGQAVIAGVPAGTHPVRVSAASLPVYYEPGTAPVPPVGVPQPAGSEHAVGVTLPTGTNQPWTYMAFGDSVTLGDGATDGQGYRRVLDLQLATHFGRSHVINEGISGTRSNDGATRIGPLLDEHRPSYTLILYGINDWNDRFCRDEPPCYTVDSLRDMVREVRSVRSLPVLSTIIPANEGISDRVPPERNIWVSQINELIRAMARQEQVALADPHRLFLAEPALAPLFTDHVHPSDRGYQLIAQAFFDAITRPPNASSTSRPRFGPALPR